MSNEPTISQLLAGVSAGDPAAAECLFGRMASDGAEGADLLHLVRAILPPHDRARGAAESQDYLQSALRDGWIDIEKFRGTSKAELYGWLRTIIRRKIGDAMRKKRFELFPEGMGDERAGEGAGESHSPLADLVKREAVKRVHRAVEKLQGGQREVLELSLKGRSTAQIATELNLSPEAVRKRRSRAAEELRTLLK